MKTSLIKIFSFPAILLTMLITYYIHAQNLINWPVNLPGSLSATLGEIRGFSLHQGIDIKTGGRAGYPVFAASSGKLSRLISKEYGYGNAIFINHGNSIQSVYGHLDSFEEGKHHLNTLSKTLKVLNNNDQLNFRFYKSNLLYKADEKIAYTGETGSGTPHLHFEIRKNNEFLNPLKFLNIKDDQSPVIETIYVCAEKDNTTITEKKINVKKRWWTYRTVKKPVKISGSERIFFKLSCYDRVGALNRVAIYKIKLFVDEKKIFETAFDAFKKSDFKHGYQVYDISRSTISGGVSYAYILCRREGTDFSGIKSNDNGYIYLNKKEKDIRIDVSDFAGNVSTLEFQLSRKDVKDESDRDFLSIKKGKKYYLNEKIEGAKAVIYPNSLHRDTLLKISSSEKYGLVKEIKKTSSIKNKDIFKIFSLYPFDIIYKNPIRIIFKRPGGISKKGTKNILIFLVFQGRKPTPLKTMYNPQKDTFEALSITGGNFALIRDNIQPKIFLPPTHEFCEDRNIYRKLRFFTSDNISKIDRNSIECIIDGESFPVKFDMARKWIEVVLPGDTISRGLHHILVMADDRAGNQAVFRSILSF